MANVIRLLSIKPVFQLMAITFSNATMAVVKQSLNPFLQSLPDFQEQAKKKYYQAIKNFLGNH